MFEQEDVNTGLHIDPTTKELNFNPKFETLFAPQARLSEFLATSCKMWESLHSNIKSQIDLNVFRFIVGFR